MRIFDRVFKREERIVQKEPVKRKPNGGGNEEPLIISTSRESNKEELKERRKYTSMPEELVLESGDKSSSKELGGGVNETVFVELKDNGSGVFKPKDGQMFPYRDYYKRERAAYLVDRFLGFDMVPPTVVRMIDGRIGSFQQFIRDARMGSELQEVEHSLLPDKDKVKLFLFDFLISNIDRNGNNFLIKDNRIYAIDHGLSFGRNIYPLGSYYGYDYNNKPEIPSGVIEKIRKLNFEPEVKSILRDLLLELLPESEVEAFFQRLEILLERIQKSEGCLDRKKIMEQIEYE